MPRFRPPRVSFRVLLAGASGLLVIVTTLAILAVSFGASRRTTYDLLNDQAALAVHAVEEGVRDRLSSIDGLVDGLARRDQAAVIAGDDATEVERLLAASLAVVPEAHLLVAWGDGLPPIALRRAGHGGVLRVRETPDEAFLARLEEVGRAPSRWSDPVFQNGAPYLYAVRRFDADGREFFLAAGVALRRFSRELDSIGRLIGGTAFILYDDDGVLAHPALELRSSFGDTMPRLGELGDPVLRGLGAAKAAVFAPGDESRQVEALRVGEGDAVRLVLLRDLRGFGPDGWRLGVHFDASETRESIMRLVGAAGVGLVFSLIGVVVALISARLISGPVRRLARSAEAVSRLDLKGVQLPERSPIREIDEQAQAFRLMIDGLTTFATYVPRQLVRRLLDQGHGHAMASVERELTVMFTDVRGFTAIADRMGPEDTAAFLNRHFALLETCIAGTGGTIDKYIGDAVMAFWGAPEDMSDHAARAVEAARGMARRLAEDNARRARKGLKPVRLRIGLHTGPAVVGNIGAPGRVNYTIVGPTVNIAQRLEELGHALDDGEDVTVIMTEATATAAGLGAADYEGLGSRALRGLPGETFVVRLVQEARSAASAPEDAGAAEGAPRDQSNRSRSSR